MSRTFACITRWSSQNKSAEKHVCNGQTSSNMSRNFCLKHFHISQDTDKKSVARHKANFASGSSFALRLPLIFRQYQHVTVDLIISQLISEKCAA